MKNSFKIPLGVAYSIILLFFITTSAFHQVGSVELRYSDGTLVSINDSIAETYDSISKPMTQSYLIKILSTYNQSSETIPITLTL